MFPLSAPVCTAYKAHTDCVLDGTDLRDRVATVLVYLDDVHDGGETKFPGEPLPLDVLDSGCLGQLVDDMKWVDGSVHTSTKGVVTCLDGWLVD